MYNFEPYNVLLAIATNTPALLMTASVLQGHFSGAARPDYKAKRDWLQREPAMIGQRSEAVI